jgi:hypothetical protein
MIRIPPSIVPALDADRFATRHWWSDPGCRERVDALRSEAERGHRRPFQIMTCTAGGPHLREVARSFIDLIEHAGLDQLQVAGRPLLRWLLVERERCPSIDAMAATLSSSGVEVLRRPAPTTAYASIADGRRALLEAAESLDLSDTPIVLLLDDDLAFDALVSGPTGLELGTPWPWLPALWAYHDAHPDIDVAVGGVSGAPPLPASSTLVTNLFDLDAALHGRPTYDAATRWSEVDHYYDLSPVRAVRDPYPLLEPLPNGSALLDALMIHGTLARPLVATPTTLAQSRPAPIVRGGNTVVFEPRWLRLPHPQARLGELRLRRADTVWAQAAVSLHDCRLGQLPWPLRHLRDERGFTTKAAVRWRERLLADLGGVGLYRGIERWRNRAPWRNARALARARADVLECIGERRVQVTGALHDARRACSRLVDHRPELTAVGAAIDEGLDAIAALELEPDAITSLLDGLSASLEIA